MKHLNEKSPTIYAFYAIRLAAFVINMKECRFSGETGHRIRPQAFRSHAEQAGNHGSQREHAGKGNRMDNVRSVWLHRPTTHAYKSAMRRGTAVLQGRSGKHRVVCPNYILIVSLELGTRNDLLEFDSCTSLRAVEIARGTGVGEASVAIDRCMCCLW